MLIISYTEGIEFLFILICNIHEFNRFGLAEILSLSRHYQLTKPKLHLWILVQVTFPTQIVIYAECCDYLITSHELFVSCLLHLYFNNHD